MGKRRAEDGELPEEAKFKKRNDKQVVLSTVESLKLREGKTYANLLNKIASKKKCRKFELGSPVIIASCHKNFLKAVSVSPTGNLATCDLGGHIRFWNPKGKNGALVCDYVTSWTRDHPEAIAWHPKGNKLYIAYRNNEKEIDEPRQVARVSKTKGVKFLRHAPHEGYTPRCIRFMPWKVSGLSCFVTGADDHSVVLWSRENGHWHPKPLLKNLHTASVYGVDGRRDKSFVLSAGMDKLLVVYDVAHGNSYFSGKGKHKLLDVQVNPSDPNLMFTTASGPENEQMSLHDMRQIQLGKPLHQFGWLSKVKATKQIHQFWSPDGLFISTGSFDKKYLIYDVRYLGSAPANTVTGHEGTVLQAEWHPQLTNTIVSFTKNGHIWLQDWS